MREGYQGRVKRFTSADIITLSRFFLSLVLALLRAGSIGFCAVFVLAGLTDIADGYVARRTGTATARGAYLDTAADIPYYAVSVVKTLIAIGAPVWLWCWTGAIALIKAAGAALEKRLYGRSTAHHTRLNRLTGAILFVFILTTPIVRSTACAAAVCAVATVAAIWETGGIVTGREKKLE